MVNPTAVKNQHVLRFQELGKGDVLVAGGKGASLGELTRAGIRVPEGFVVTTHAFQWAVTTIDANGEIVSAVSSLDGRDLRASTKVGAWARARVEAAPLPEELVSQVAQRYRELCAGAGQDDLPVAVRSSATAEDSAEDSFAGLQDTYLWVRGAEEVNQAARRCWASLYSVDSITYRRRRGLPEDGLAMESTL
jgi:pyruvate,water dikinase